MVYELTEIDTVSRCAVEPPEKLKAPEIRELTLAEQQQLRELGEAMAKQTLGSDWKESVAKKDSGIMR